MKLHVHCCERMSNSVASSELPVAFVAKFREYGIAVLDGGTSHVQIDFCPWCGTKLPLSLRSKWFEDLDRLGIDPYGDELPSEYLDGRWYTEPGRST